MTKRDPTRNQILKITKEIEQLAASVKTLLDTHDGVETVDVPNQGLWTRDEVRTLWERVIERTGADQSAFGPTHEGLWHLFMLTSERAGEWVTFTQLLKVSELDDRTQRNALAELTKMSKDLFGDAKWPIETKQAPYRVEIGKAEKIYRMSPKIAEWWQDVALDD